jgi:hypothetical protein
LSSLSHIVEPQDPQATPPGTPFTQGKQTCSGSSNELDPPADYGETSYRGNGRLAVASLSLQLPTAAPVVPAGFPRRRRYPRHFLPHTSGASSNEAWRCDPQHLFHRSIRAKDELGSVRVNGGGHRELTKSLSKLCMKHGVPVNSVAAGSVWTPLIPATTPEKEVESFGANTLFEWLAQPGSSDLRPLQKTGELSVRQSKGPHRSEEPWLMVKELRSTYETWFVASRCRVYRAGFLN